jgi:phytoene desaturase
LKIVVVGAGFAGLAAAPLLAKQGYDVTVIEKNNFLGGRARSLNENGFIFDTGPTWYLMPDVFERYFSEFNYKPSDFYELLRLEPAYRVFFEKEKIIDISSNLENNFQIFDQIEYDGGNKLRKYLELSKYIYDVAMKNFVYKDYSNILDLMAPGLLFKGIKLNIFGKMDTLVNKFFNSDYARKIIQYTLVFLGGTPKITPALYSLMGHVDFNLGVWYPKGGLGEVVKAFYKLGNNYGVKFQFGESVKKIQIKNRNAKNVITEKNIIPSDTFLFTSDYHHVETELLEEKHQSYPDKYWQKKIIAPSAFIILLGINNRLSSLKHHNLFLMNDWINHFDEIFDNPSWPQFPSFYLGCPSKTDDSVAPNGHENLFVLVPIASGLEDTQKIRERYFQKIISTVEEITGEKIFDYIVYKKIFCITDFLKYYNSWRGTALGLAHTLRQSALFRPRHKSKKIKNVYFAGQYTHPGIGVPTSIISSQIATKRIFNEYRL